MQGVASRYEWVLQKEGGGVKISGEGVLQKRNGVSKTNWGIVLMQSVSCIAIWGSIEEFWQGSPPTRLIQEYIRTPLISKESTCSLVMDVYLLQQLLYTSIVL